MSSVPIAINVAGPLPVSTSFQAPVDGPTTFVFSGTAWSQATNVPIGVQVLLDGVLIGTATLFSNTTGEHRTLPTQVMLTKLSFGTHKVTFQAMNGSTITDANDNFSLSILL